MATKIAARGSWCHWASFVHNEAAALVVFTIEHGNCLVCSVIGFEFYESEAAGATGHFVYHYVGGGHCACLGEQVFQVIAGGCPWKAANKQLLSHYIRLSL